MRTLMIREIKYIAQCLTHCCWYNQESFGLILKPYSSNLLILTFFHQLIFLRSSVKDEIPQGLVLVLLPTPPPLPPPGPCLNLYCLQVVLIINYRQIIPKCKSLPQILSLELQVHKSNGRDGRQNSQKLAIYWF